ncbi:hypothetical protein bpr_II141 (plasmid) [Butyrivibrio proteoclasticus B316]|uniref:Uncharacterized protein n=1 Tax=Butyrivibrio proteoclasticus (strain ATCC 51982 / DSM 14932 / B316) TaxID=515622 RepID=E0S3U7_BUTPB|nr:hypothetical protein [Butyrivibrio proteoclasticus]ADL36079.1 hypothetical protein bpr_II141 [Butyrivibrio proteoclasticus B316]
MTKVIVVVEGGMVTSVYTRNKNIDVEVLDFDTQSFEDDELKEMRKRLDAIEKSKTYKDIR